MGINFYQVDRRSAAALLTAGSRLVVKVQGFEGDVIVDFLDEKALPTIIVSPRADCDSESFLMTQEAK